MDAMTLETATGADEDGQCLSSPVKPALKVLAVTRGMLLGREAFTAVAARHPYAGVGGDYRELLTTSALGALDDDEPALLLAALGDLPIGRISLFNGLAHAGGRPIPMIWCSGLDVQDQYRQTGAGLLLLLRLRAMNVPIGVVGVSRRALDIYTKLGWRDMAATRYIFLLRSGPIMSVRLGAGLISRMLEAGIDGLLRLHRIAFSGLCLWRLRNLRVERCDAMPADLDQLIQNGAGVGPRCHRSARWVNWCMTTGPKENQRSLHLVKSRSGEALGYFVHSLLTHSDSEENVRSFTGLRLASLRDWMSFDQKRLPDSLLIAAAVKSMMQRNADAIEVCVPEHDVAVRLRWIGMHPRGKLHFLFRAPPGVWQSAAGENDWWWRPADGDGFIN